MSKISVTATWSDLNLPHTHIAALVDNHPKIITIVIGLLMGIPVNIKEGRTTALSSCILELYKFPVRWYSLKWTMFTFQ